MEKFKGFLEKILTMEDLLFFLGEIKLAESVIFVKPEVPFFEKIKGVVSQEFIEELKKLESLSLFPKNPPEISEFLKELKEILQSLPILKLELAFLPSRSFLEKISLFLGKKIVLDVKVNPEIVGGAILEYKGKYLNLSLEKKVAEIQKTLSQK